MKEILIWNEKRQKNPVETEEKSDKSFIGNIHRISRLERKSHSYLTWKCQKFKV